MKINFIPDKSHLFQIQKWLMDEANSGQNGFIGNWSIIEKSFEKKELIILELDKKVCGFLVYEICNISKVANIKIANVRYEYIGKKLGRYLIEETMSNFIKGEVILAKLFCCPEKSEGFWLEMNFKRYPEDLIYNGKIEMYRLLSGNLEPTEIRRFLDY